MQSVKLQDKYVSKRELIGKRVNIDTLSGSVVEYHEVLIPVKIYTIG